MRLLLLSLLAMTTACVGALGSTPDEEQDPAPVVTKPGEAGFYGQRVWPLFAERCVGCHSGSEPSGNLSLERFASEDEAKKDHALLEKVLQRVSMSEMPPPTAGPRVTAGQRLDLQSWIEGVIFAADCEATLDPLPAELHRLSKRELTNTLRDLLYLPATFDPTKSLAEEDGTAGFSNIDKTLPVNRELVAAVLDIAIAAVDRSLADPASPLLFSTNADEVLGRFLTRAYRREPTVEERTAVTQVYAAASGTFPQRIGLAMQAVIVSPAFLYKIELDDSQNPEDIHRLRDPELASRLSYFLWGTMPDDALRAAAAAGKLQTDDGLRAEVKRMLADPKRAGLVNGFASEWFRVAALKTTAVPPALQTSMANETRAFASEIFFRGDHKASELLSSDFTFVDTALASHYGLPPVSSFQRVSTAGTPRIGGILTQGAVLATTSKGMVTSPVTRGGFVLSDLLCSPPEPPPEGAETMGGEKDPLASKRVQMTQHRAAPLCSSCHATMDPIGFGLENFDHVGAFRSKEGVHPIDASGQFPTGESFRDHRDLAAIVSGHPNFDRCVTEKLMTYALGRRLRLKDRCTVVRLSGEKSIAELVDGIVMSRAFRYRRPEGSTP